MIRIPRRTSRTGGQMEKKKGKGPAPKTPAKGVKVDPKKKAGRDLTDQEMKGVAGGMRSRLEGCTCSNMPLDPG